MSFKEKSLNKQASKRLPSAFAATIEPLQMDEKEMVLYKMLEEFGIDRLSPKAAMFLCQQVLKKLAL